MPFKTLGLNADILKSLAEQGYERPTPIQQQAIPVILQGRDVLGIAQTGTGKTAAFALPIIHRLVHMPADKSRRGPALPRALILSPTRELAAQIGESFGTYGRHAGLSHTVIFGGVSQFHQVRALHRGVDILVATPGRLIDLMEQRLVTLSQVCIFVLDEADRMLDMGFIRPIQRVAAALPSPRQTLLFSATMPREIMHLADSLLRDPAKVSVAPTVSTVPKIAQRLYMVQTRQKQALLEHLLAEPGVSRAIVFTKTKHGADRVCKRLHQHGVEAVAIHGNKAQNYRARALEAFRTGRTPVLVATDVAARGLDVDEVSHVFNFDLPMEPEAYVHRIGRTARAGAEGIAISFCDGSEMDLLRQVQRLTGKPIPQSPLPDLPPVPLEHHEPRTPQHRGAPHRGAPRGDRPAGAPRDSRSHPHSGKGFAHKPGGKGHAHPNAGPGQGRSHAGEGNGNPRARPQTPRGGHAGPGGAGARSPGHPARPGIFSRRGTKRR